ncbi:LOW QUALITY PROTEIN: DNA polymerase epsilon subunit 3 [Nilaparvata lugens]|uniref:LOW QUALITY PROTEIN: DNA polymerase epsilon subunit 3 n=1 Tax=Nilaparvata lugens TaxID=108931 RepID=UPI00193E5F60|nr:LOW QUALITY PROTEIN: DNA polymerase epsilon subunit 3 [Nilaparvata lugens]
MAEKLEDLNLPNTIVTRLIKDALPDNVNVSKEARMAVAKAASVFVLYLTNSSNVVAMAANRKTINANDVLQGLKETDFVDFIPPLQEALEGFKKKSKREEGCC